MTKSLLNVTWPAIRRMKYLLSKRDPQQMIKISLIRKGCNGLSYSINYTNKKEKLDEIHQQDGLKLVLDNKSLLLLIGTEIDYVSDDIWEEFVFRNQKAKANCGCGESFFFG